MVKEELCEKVVEVIRVGNRVMTVVVFEEDVLRLICGYARKVWEVFNFTMDRKMHGESNV